MQTAEKALGIELSLSSEMMGRVEFVPHQYQVLDDTDALIIVTEWKEFKSPDFQLIFQKLSSPVIFDGRNLFEPEVMQERQFEYYGMGRLNETALLARTTE